MTGLARLAVERPRAVLGTWMAVVAVLAAIGLGLEDNLHRSDLKISGTPSDTASELSHERFGETNSLVVLLRGPRSQVDRQGRRLAASLERHDDVAVLGPWDPGAGRALRPGRERALLTLRSTRSFEEVSRRVVPAVRSDVRRLVREPVEAHVSGYPDIAAGIHGSSVEAVRRAELIAAPVLVVVLLLVFRGVVAAALPLLVGQTTIAAARGVLEIANTATPLDAVALNLASMMGLALGVDYALLFVSRFREELAAGASSREAALRSVDTAGRTIVFAAAALGAAMGAALVTAPGNLLFSSVLGTLVAVGLSLVAAMTALPAALAVLGARIDRWSFGRRDRAGFAGLALRALRRPAVAAALVAALVIALAAPALALETGPPDPRVLPADARERADFDAIGRALGPGWTAPFEITVATRRGAITAPRRLAALDRFERRIARRKDVAAVLGPGPLARRTAPLARAPVQLERARAGLERGLRDQDRLTDGLVLAGSGAARLRAGLEDAADGAGALAGGGREGTCGALLLRDGIARARSGALELRAGLADARAGSSALAVGAADARSGAAQLESGLERARAGVVHGLPRVRDLATGLDRGGRDLERLREPVGIADRELREALDALDGMLPSSKLDPRYGDAYESVATAAGAVSGRDPTTNQPVRPGYDGLDSSLAEAAAGSRRAAAGAGRLGDELGELAAGLDRLAVGARELGGGAAALEDGARRLVLGLDRLELGGGALAAGLGDLSDGADGLAGGVRELQVGASRLEGGLDEGAARTGELEQGIGRMRSGAVEARIRTRALGGSLRGSDRLVQTMRSSYFVLAALDAAPRRERKATTFALSVDRGGSAAQIVVIGRGVVSRASHPLRRGLEREMRRLERETGTVAALGGPAAKLQDFETETGSRLWVLLATLMGVTYLVLVPLLRSILLPLLAVVLNVLTVGAAFGVLVLLFEGPAPLGGPGFLDAIMVSGVLTIVFGLSIDYEVFLLARMREGYELTGTTEGAIEYGLRHTAGVVTGAALIMTGVFVAFAMSSIVSMRQLGIGLTVAVLLDATLVRLVLLPAAIRLAGDRAWAMPGRRRPSGAAAAR